MDGGLLVVNCNKITGNGRLESNGENGQSWSGAGSGARRWRVGCNFL